jgi:hypothetical protein
MISLLGADNGIELRFHPIATILRHWKTDMMDEMGNYGPHPSKDILTGN